MECQWCHNPEGLQNAPKIVYDIRRCIACSDCMDACPQAAISAAPSGMVTDNQQCKGCGTCVQVCPGCAREATQRTVTVNQLLGTLKQDVLFYDESGGGVTFSGGEPLLQSEFLVAMLDACGCTDIHRAVDTSGYADRSTVAAVAMRTDLFLYDLKLIDAERHKQFTGVTNEIILENLKYLHHLGADITIRFPLIPGVNDDDDNLSQVFRFLDPLDGIRDIHILPYHDYQKIKYSKFDMPYAAGHINKPPQDKVAACIGQFEKRGFQVSLGG